MPGISDFLTPEALRKLDTLSVRSRFVVEGSQAGAHRSLLKGASVEFADRRIPLEASGQQLPVAPLNALLTTAHQSCAALLLGAAVALAMWTWQMLDPVQRRGA
mgnify:CR=1 FL=1